MVRIELGGRPILDILDAQPGDTGKLKTQMRRRMRGVQSTKFEWKTVQPKLVLTSDTEDFDETIILHFQQEGFQITYLAYDGDHKAYQNALSHVADGLELGDRYAIV
ncbi:MAG: hypothetical protein M1823_008315, partial [Watsoniomyces obsoletus]